MAEQARILLILLVDDEQAVLACFDEFLRLNGYSCGIRTMIERTLRPASVPLGEVLHAANGAEGLEVLESSWIDLALVDINMPVMNGEEMIVRMRENAEWEDIPVIVVSTEGSQTRIERLQEKGAKFVHKPFSPEMIREIVTEVTGITHEHQT